jgi:hypothetical protein
MNRVTITTMMLGGLLFLTGCPGQKSSTTIPPSTKGGGEKDTDGHDQHGAHAPGPHKGVVFDLGKVHAEFVLDAGKQEATIYIFGNDEKTPKPIKAEKLDVTVKSPAFTVELKPLPQSGDPEGKTTRFVGKHEKFSKPQDFDATVIAVIDGKPSQGEFKFEADEH